MGAMTTDHGGELASTDEQTGARSGGVLGFIALIALGGTAVLGSYVWGVSAPGVGAALWGGVPEALRPLYTINMFLAAGGFFPFTLHVMRMMRAQDASPALRQRLHAWYALILVPSALWVPLTAWMLTAPSAGVWLLVRLDLALVALGALGVFYEVMRGPRLGAAGRRAAIVGLVPFCLQTVVLDALVWPHFFDVTTLGGLG
jgi:hypothetical protein